MGYFVQIVTSRLSAPKGLVNREKPYEHASRIDYLNSVFVFMRPLVTDPLGLARLARLVKQTDIVHVFTPFPLVESIAGIYARIYNKPLVTTYICDAVMSSNSGSKIGKVTEAAYDSLSVIPALNFSSCICSSSRSFVGQSRVLSRYSDRITVVHQGIALDELSGFDQENVKRFRDKLLENQYKTLITFVGRLVPYKGVKYLIQAFDLMVKEKNENCMLAIGGSGPERSNLEKEVLDRGLSKRVKFLGYVLDIDLPVLLAASDVFVVPSISTNESTAITLLQAMALGVPVIGTSIGGTAETVPNDGINGIIVREKDPLELKSAIKSILEKKHEKNSAGNLARTWNDVTIDYSGIYQSLPRVKHHSTNLMPKQSLTKLP